MAQTKRKRRSKHRGNAAGTIESRGRTGRRPTAQESKKKDARGRRQMKEPTWRSAATKASVMALVLFVLTQAGLFGRNTTIAQGVFLACLAMALYTPLAYLTDRIVYNRLQKRQAAGKS
jgi:hypothetical protein